MNNNFEKENRRKISSDSSNGIIQSGQSHAVEDSFS